MALRSFWITLCVTSLLFVGCGQDEPAERAGGNAAQTEPNDGGEVVGDDGRGPSNLKSSQVDLKFITADFAGALVIRPADIMKTPFFRECREIFDAETVVGVPSRTMSQDGKRLWGFDPLSIEEVVFLLERPSVFDTKPHRAHQPALIVRFGKPVDPATAVRAAWNGARLERLVEKKHEGKTILVEPLTERAVYLVDDRTIVAGPENLVRRMIVGETGDTWLTRELASRGRHQIVAVFEFAPLSDTISQFFRGAPPPIAVVAQAAQQFQSLSLEVDFSGDTLLAAELVAKVDDTARSLESRAHEVIESLTVQLSDLEKDASSPIPDGLRQSAPFLIDQLSKISLTRAGTSIKVAVVASREVESLAVRLKGAMLAARAAARRGRQRGAVHHIGHALNKYHSKLGHFPTAIGPGYESPKIKSGSLSWRVHLLPFVDELELYEEFHLDEPWDSAHNKRLVSRMPLVYGLNPDGKSQFHVFIGQGTPFGARRGVRFDDVVDGSLRTIALVEAGPDKAEIWTKPGGLPFDPKNPIAALGNIGDKFLVVFLDGQVRELPRTIDADTLSKLIQHADGAPVEIP